MENDLVLLNEMNKATSQITTGKNETTIKLNVGLHPEDVERLHDAIFPFLQSCFESKKAIEEANSTLHRIAKSRGVSANYPPEND